MPTTKELPLMCPVLKLAPLKLALCAAALGAGSLAASPNASAQPTQKEHRASDFNIVMHSRGQLGAKVFSMSDDLRRYFGAAKDTGLLVDKVLPDTPAAMAGLKSGDVITAVEGNRIAEAMDIFHALGNAQKGDTVSVEIIRDKKKRTLNATLDGKGKMNMQWSSSSGGPFEFDFGDMNMDFGRGFPFGLAPPAMQEQLRRLEERLNRLEGITPKAKKTPKS